MDMEMNADLGATIDQLTAAAEQVLARLEEKIAAAEQRIADLDARAATDPGAPFTRSVSGNAATESGRKTFPTAMTTLLSKQGVTLDAESLEAGAVDAALASLSLEQRIAVKSQLLRAGLLS